MGSGQRAAGRAELSTATAWPQQHSRDGQRSWVPLGQTVPRGPKHVSEEPLPGSRVALGSVTCATRVCRAATRHQQRLGLDRSTDSVDTHLCCLAAWAGCAVALPLPRALLTPALAPADLSDLGARHQWLQGQEGLTFQPALAGAPARGPWEPGWEGHRAVVSASFLSTADLPVG